MKKQIFCVFVLMFSFVLFQPAVAEDEVPEEYKSMQNPVMLSESDVPYWREQYLGKCARCHGDLGKGDGESADLEEGGIRPVDFTDVDYMNSRTDGELYYQIEMGGEEKSAMPDFGPDSAQGWGERKIWSMVAFIRMFAQPKK